MAETPLNKDQLPLLGLDDLTGVTVDGKDAFLAGQSSGSASAANRFATINDVLTLADGGVFSRIGLFGNNGFVCGLDCWENESPFPLATHPLTEMEKVRVVQAYAGPQGTDLSCGCPGLGIEIVKGYEGCSFDVIAQSRDFKCKELLICDNEFTLQLTAFVWSQSITLPVTPTARVQFFNEGVYLGEKTFNLTANPVVSGAGATPTKIDSLVNITVDCCADEVRVILGFTTDDQIIYSEDVAIFVQSFQMVGRLGAVFGPLPREILDSPTINLVSPEGLVQFDLSASQQTTILERSEEALGWSWDSGGKIAGNWETVDIQSNAIKKTMLQRVGCGIEVTQTTKSQPGWDDSGLQYAVIDSPIHLLDQTSGGETFDIDFRLVLNPKAENAAVNITLRFRRNAATVDDAWTDETVVAIPAGGSGTIAVDLSTLTGGPDGTWEFVLFVDDGDAGFWSDVVMIGFNVGVPTDFDERPARFVNTNDPICTGSYGLRVRRSLDRFVNTAFRPFVDFLDLSQNQVATHIRITLECAINENIDQSFPAAQFNPLGSGFGADIRTGPIVMLTDANGSSRVLGRIRLVAGGDLDANSQTMQDCIVEYDDGLGGSSVVVPIGWLTGQQVATTNSNALIPFDYTRIASLEIISPSSQMLLRTLTLDMGVGDDGSGGFNTLITSQEVDLTDDYTQVDLNDRWTQAGPAMYLRHYDDTRLYWGEYHEDDLNFEDEFELAQRMSLISIRALNRMNTAFMGCPIDEMEVDANYIALHRTNNFEWDISSTNRDVFYSAFRRVFDDEGYVDISSVCTVDDGTKRRFVFPDIQFNVAVPAGHYYQFQATLVDDRGNKLVGSWSPVLSPRNNGVIIRTERWADTDEFDYLNGSFSVDADAIYAAQLEDFNFTRVSELIVRVLGARPQNFDSTSIWETYNEVGFPGPTEAVTFAAVGYQVALRPVGFHEGQLVANVHIYPYDETIASLSTLNDITLQFGLSQGFISDRLVWGSFTIDSELGFETAEYEIELSTGSHTNSDNVVMTVLIGGLNAAIRNGTESLLLTLTSSGTSFFTDTEREASIILSSTELANVIDDPEFSKPCVAIGAFCVQGPGGSLVLDNLSKYDLDNDPAGAIACFRRDWAEVTESNTIAQFDFSNYLANSTLFDDDGVRVINYDGGLLVLMDEATDASLPLDQWEVLSLETNAHPHMHKVSGGTAVMSTASGSVRPGWLNMFKFSLLVNFGWENTDPVTGAAIPFDSLAVLDVDWGVLAGRSRGWSIGATDAERQTIWISKAELQELGVFLIDENFASLPADTLIVLKRAGFFFEGYSNQIHNLDFDNFTMTMLGADPPNDPGIGGNTLDDETVGCGCDAALLATFTASSSTDYMASIISQAAAEQRVVPLFNRGLRVTGPTTGSRLGKNNQIAYTPGTGVLTITSTEMVAGVGFLNPDGFDLSTLGTVTVTVANVTGPTERFGFAILRTNYGRQLLSEQKTVPAGGGVAFTSFTTARADEFTYEPSVWEVGRIFRDIATEPAFNTEFQGNWAELGAERVVAIEFYVVATQRSADGTAWSFDVSLVTDGSTEYFNATNLDSAFNGYDPETAGRAVWIDRSSDRNFCKVHSAAINARSNRSTMFLHWRPDRYGQANNDRLVPPTAADLSSLDKLKMDLRAFGPHYLMIVAIENDGTDWTVIDADSGGSRLVLPESPEIRDYARSTTPSGSNFDADDTTPLTFYKVAETLEATSITDPVEEFLIIVIPLHSFHGPSVDIDDLALRTSADVLLFGETYDYRGQTDLLRNWDAEFTPGQEKMSQTPSLTHPQLWWDPYQQNLDGARRAFKDDHCGDLHPHNVLETGDSVDCCRLPLLFSTEPEQLKYFDDTNYDQGGKGAVLVPSLAGFEAIDEAAARTGEVFFHTPAPRGVNNRILGYAYQRHTGCCLGVPIRTRDVEFTAPECGCGGGPSGIVGITNFITHPKLGQAIVDDNFVLPGFPVGVRRDDYGVSFCFSFKRDTTPPATEWVDFDSTTSPQRVFYAGGGRPDPGGPFPGDNLFVTIYLGPNSSATSSRQAFIATDVILRGAREHTFDMGVHDVSGFAIGFPVWVRNGCSLDGCKFDLCAVRQSEDSNVAGVYGVVKAVDVPGNTITVEFNDPVEATFNVSQFAEVVVSPDGAAGFYLEFSPDFLNEVTDPDLNATLIRWGFRYWETTEPLGQCGCGDGGGYICDGDATSVFNELIGDDTDDPVHPRDFFGTFNPPAQHTLLNEDALPGQSFIEICNPEKYEDDAPIAVVDNMWVNGFVARVVGRDMLRKRLFLDRRLPLSTESLCGWDPTPFDGFLTGRAAIVYRLVDFLPIATRSVSDFLDPRGIPQQEKVFFNASSGQFVFHPNDSAFDFWVRYFDSNTRIQLPKEGGLYRLVGVGKCGLRTQASEHISVFGANRQQLFFEERGFKVVDGQIMPLQPPVPPVPEVPPAGYPFGTEQFEGTTPVPGGATTINFQTLFFDAPPPGPMAGDADSIDINANVTNKVGSGDAALGVVYDVRLYLVQETRFEFRAGVDRVFTDPAAELRYSHAVSDGDKLGIVGNAAAGAEILFIDPGDGGAPFADVQFEVKELGSVSITLTKLAGPSFAPDTQQITFLSRAAEHEYELVAWDAANDPLVDGLMELFDDAAANDVRVGLGKFAQSDQPSGPGTRQLLEIIKPASDLGPFDVTNSQGNWTYSGAQVTIASATGYATILAADITVGSDGPDNFLLENGPTPMAFPFSEAEGPAGSLLSAELLFFAAASIMSMEVEVGSPLAVASGGFVDLGDVAQTGANEFDLIFRALNDAAAGASLNLNGAPQVVFSNFSGFAISVPVVTLADPIAAGGSSQDTVAVLSSAPGVGRFDVSIESDDPLRNPYTFTVRFNLLT